LHKAILKHVTFTHKRKFIFYYYFFQFKGRSSLVKLIINFIIVALLCIFLISLLYKNSNSVSNQAENSDAKPVAEKRFQKPHKSEPRPIVLQLLSYDEFEYIEPNDSFFKQKHNILQKRIDWHDHKHINAEKARKGPGEQGKAFKLTDPQDISLNTELLKLNGYYARASDIISVNRSVADIRHPL
jgi:uncharacterized membrane protein